MSSASPVQGVPVGISFGIPQPPPLYVNGVQVHATPWDIGFEFQQLIPIGIDENGAPQVSKQIVARIIMSPQHARAFVNSAVDVLQQWEAKNGPIQLPDMGTVKE